MATCKQLHTVSQPTPIVCSHVFASLQLCHCQYTEGHEQWWDTIWEAQAARGQAVTTVSPEHGPPNYQQTVPGTRQPLASIWEVNHFIAQRQADRFQAKHGQGSASQLQPLETVDWDAVD